MTAAERQQRKRDRQKAGLVRFEAWIPADKADAVREAVARALAADWIEYDFGPFAKGGRADGAGN